QCAAPVTASPPSPHPCGPEQLRPAHAQHPHLLRHRLPRHRDRLDGRRDRRRALGGEAVALGWWLRARRARRARRTRPDTPGQLRAARALRQSRLRAQLHDVRDAVGALADAVVLFDDQGRVRWFNAAATRLLGVRREHVGQPLAQWLDGSELGTWLRTNATQPAADLPAPADASLRLAATIIPFGQQLKVLLARDISTLSRLEQVRRDFVANVSH